MGKRGRLKIMSIVMKTFSVAAYVMEWYSSAGQDEKITKEELAELGLGICNVLGLKTDIDLGD